MKHVPTVAWRELRSLFVSPVAYVVLSLFAVLAGSFFMLGVAGFVEYELYLRQIQSAEGLASLNLNDDLLVNFFGTMSIILLFLIPAITMGLFASEKTNGTQELLLTSPLTIWDIVLGKFVAAAAFVGLLVAIVGAYPAVLFAYGDPEAGKTLTGLLGLLLVGWGYTSIGCFASSLTRSQVVGYLIALVVLLLMMLLPVIAQLAVSGDGPGGVAAVMRWMSTEPHFQALLGGLVDTADLAYFGVLIGTFLLLTKAAVESVRWR